MGAIRVGTVIAGKYRLEAPLAQGGMGSVWAAQHISLDRRLAIKFIGPEIAGLDEARKRFEREAKVAAVLQSPHVIQIHDYGVDADVPYLVMELLEGEDLGARLARRGALSLAETVSLVTQVARALRRAADAGVVHRDLKPGNIFVVPGDEDDEELVKVLDFGVAKVPRLADDDATLTGAMIGSPRYMSPEQARGSRLVDHRSDLWSLAVIAYRALTGRLPFHGDDVADLIFDICSGTAAPPSHFEPALTLEIDAFFERALARAPDARFQTARELAAAFAVAAGEAPPRSMSSANLSVSALALSARPRTSQTVIERSAAPAAAPDARGAAALEPTRPSAQPSPAAARAAELHDEREATAPEPFARRRDRAAPEGTPTTAAGSIQAPTPRGLRPPHALVGAGLAIAALAGALLATSVGRRPVSSVVVQLSSVPRAASGEPSSATPGDRPAVAPIPAPQASASASPTPSASASAVAPPRPAPRPFNNPAKKHSVFGI